MCKLHITFRGYIFHDFVTLQCSLFSPILTQFSFSCSKPRWRSQWRFGWFTCVKFNFDFALSHSLLSVRTSWYNRTNLVSARHEDGMSALVLRRIEHSQKACVCRSFNYTCTHFTLVQLGLGMISLELLMYANKL